MTLMPAGMPTTFDLHSIMESDIFRKMEAFSDDFLSANREALGPYSKRWVADPFHQWSRLWEYPFVFERLAARLDRNGKSAVLDAGSGVTFFPYYINSQFKDVEVHCCDYDSSLGQIFDKLNSNKKEKIRFSVSDIRKLPYRDCAFEAIYCISVMEHTENFDAILAEFGRVLKKGGSLIVTFDISLDGRGDIPVPRANELLNSLYRAFPNSEDIRGKFSEMMSSKELLTTSYVARLDRSLLPWKDTPASMLKSLLRLRMPGSVPKLSVFCHEFIK